MTTQTEKFNFRLRSFAFSGIEARPVWVEVQISTGLPAFLIVGLPDKAVAEGAKISVRGLGKIKLHAVNGRTKKDRISVVIHRYV